MPTASEPDSDHTCATAPVPANDAAGRLLSALLAAAGVGEPAAGPVLAES